MLVGKDNRQLVVDFIAGVVGDAIICLFADQSAKRITLKDVTDWCHRCRGEIALQWRLIERSRVMADRGHRGVLVDAPAAVQILFGRQGGPGHLGI